MEEQLRELEIQYFGRPVGGYYVTGLKPEGIRQLLAKGKRPGDSDGNK